MVLALGLSAVPAEALFADELPPPTFSVKHGLKEKAFNLTLRCSNENSTIVYTTDGSTPSATNGTTYASPLNINRTTCVRAISLPTMPDDEASATVTSTYIFLDDVLKQSNSPEGYPSHWGEYEDIWGTSIADYEMDPEIVNKKGMAENIKEGFRSLPIISIVTDIGNLFSPEKDEETGGIYMFTGAYDGVGNGWTRAASFEVFADRGCTWFDGSDIQEN